MPSSGRCRVPGRCRGRCGRGTATRAARTARRSPGGRGWAASRHRSRHGSARCGRRDGRSAHSASCSRRSPCCGARRPRSAEARGDRPSAPAPSCRRARRPTSPRRGPPRDRGRRVGSRIHATVPPPAATCVTALACRGRDGRRRRGSRVAVWRSGRSAASRPSTASSSAAPTTTRSPRRRCSSTPTSTRPRRRSAGTSRTSRRRTTPAGFNLDDVFPPEIESSLVNAVLPNGARVLRRPRPSRDLAARGDERLRRRALGSRRRRDHPRRR